jgi:hypothetical protein
VTGILPAMYLYLDGSKYITRDSNRNLLGKKIPEDNNFTLMIKDKIRGSLLYLAGDRQELEICTSPCLEK